MGVNLGEARCDTVTTFIWVQVWSLRIMGHATVSQPDAAAPVCLQFLGVKSQTLRLQGAQGQGSGDTRGCLVNVRTEIILSIHHTSEGICYTEHLIQPDVRWRSTESPRARGLPGRGRRASGARDAGELMPNAAFRYRRINPNEEIVNKGQSIQVRGDTYRIY